MGNAIKKAGDFMSTPIKKGYQFVKKIPILGDVVEKTVSNIPVVVETVDKYLSNEEIKKNPKIDKLQQTYEDAYRETYNIGSEVKGNLQKAKQQFSENLREKARNYLKEKLSGLTSRYKLLSGKNIVET